MKTVTGISLVTLAVALLYAAVGHPQSQPAVRTLLEQHDQSGVPGKEIVIGSAILPTDSAIGYHTHPGDEIGYVLKGALLLKTRGQPDRPLKEGDTFFNARGAVHSLTAAPGSDGGTVISTWIVDKGEPLAKIVP